MFVEPLRGFYFANPAAYATGLNNHSLWQSIKHKFFNSFIGNRQPCSNALQG
jgi:hypothetical protein